MSKVLRVVVVLLAVVGFAYIAMLAIFFLAPRLPANCRGYLVMEVPSPGSEYLATVDNNTCTPTHDLQTTVTVSGGLGTSGSAFIASSAIRDAGTYSPLAIRLTWLGDSQL